MGHEGREDVRDEGGEEERKRRGEGREKGWMNIEDLYHTSSINSSPQPHNNFSQTSVGFTDRFSFANFSLMLLLLFH